MKKTSVYIALGSNKGNKLLYIDKSVRLIFEKVGDIIAVSKLYVTPAWGFEGNDFINACILIETRFSAEKTLAELLSIENLLGRTRNEGGYEDRTIDLDIVFYGDEIITTDKLQIPHPRIQERKFVLYPLADIAEDFIHPKTKQPIATLLNESNDTSDIQSIAETIEIPKIELKNINYLAIEGNIGAGKTSLATMISEDFNAKLITERYKDNPFLPKFYKNQARYAFPLEMSFLADRYQQLADDISQYNLFNDFMVADYDAYKSLIFAKVTLPQDEFSLYKKLFDIMYKQLPKPDLYIYLSQNTECLLKNIAERGRDYEQNISAEYLDKLNKGYLDFIKNQHHLQVKIIDISSLDFVNNRVDYLVLLNEIAK